MAQPVRNGPGLSGATIALYASICRAARVIPGRAHIEAAWNGWESTRFWKRQVCSLIIVCPDLKGRSVNIKIVLVQSKRLFGLGGLDTLTPYGSKEGWIYDGSSAFSSSS